MAQNIVSKMVEKKQFIRVLLSPLFIILTVIILPSTGKSLLFLPLIFAFSIFLFNGDKLKIKPKVLILLIASAQSYAVFLGLAIVLYLLDDYMPEIYIAENQFDFKGIALVTFGGYLAALLLFYFYTFLFKVQYKRMAYLIISVAYAVVMLVMQVFSNNEFLQFGVEKFTSFLISWLIFMSLAYSLAINNLLVKIIFKKS